VTDAASDGQSKSIIQNPTRAKVTMITMIYYGHEVEVLPVQDNKNHQWLIKIRVRKQKYGEMTDKIFEFPETCPTQKDAINKGLEYGKKVVDREIIDFSISNL
jgi:hypothetical protein